MCDIFLCVRVPMLACLVVQAVRRLMQYAQGLLHAAMFHTMLTMHLGQLVPKLSAHAATAAGLRQALSAVGAG